jgi:hypothetical protein
VSHPQEGPTLDGKGEPCIPSIDARWQPRVPILSIEWDDGYGVHDRSGPSAYRGIVTRLNLTGGAQIAGDETFKRKRWEGAKAEALSAGRTHLPEGNGKPPRVQGPSQPATLPSAKWCEAAGVGASRQTEAPGTLGLRGAATSGAQG